MNYVELKGFKAFKDLTRVNFHRGTNCIVGANGSGKSSLLEAISLVVSEVYRRKAAIDVKNLLHKGVRHMALAAFVELCFSLDSDDTVLSGVLADNDQNQDPDRERIQSRKKEVRLKRLFTDIEGKQDQFFMDGKKVTKGEFVSFLESGQFSKTNPYYVVRQGRIVEMALMTDEGRLRLLKDFSGVQIYEEKRKAAEDTLVELEDKVSDIDYVLEDFTAKLKHLEQQEADFETYQKLKEKSKLYGLCLKEIKCRSRQDELRRLEGSMEEIARMLSELEEKTRGQEEVQARLTERQGVHNALGKEIKLLEKSLADLHKSLNVQRSEAGRFVRERETLEAEIREKARRLALVEKRLASFKDRVEKLADKGASLEAQEKGLRKTKRELEAIVASHEAKVERCGTYDDVTSRKKMINEREIPKMTEMIAQQKKELTGREEELTRVQEELAREQGRNPEEEENMLREECKEVNHAIDEQKTILRSANAILTDTRQKLSAICAISQDGGGLGGRGGRHSSPSAYREGSQGADLLERLQSAYRPASWRGTCSTLLHYSRQCGESGSLLSSFYACCSRARSLTQTPPNSSAALGAGHNPRSAHTLPRGSTPVLPPVIGPVWAVLEVAPQWQAAVRAALGNAVENLVVANDEVGEEVAKILQLESKRVGRHMSVNVAPLEQIAARFSGTGASLYPADVCLNFSSDSNVPGASNAASDAASNAASKASKRHSLTSKRGHGTAERMTEKQPISVTETTHSHEGNQQRGGGEPGEAGEIVGEAYDLKPEDLQRLRVIPLMAVVKAPAVLRPLVRQLLQHYVLTDTLESAKGYAGRLNMDCMTPEGDKVGKAGVLQGGYRSSRSNPLAIGDEFHRTGGLSADSRVEKASLANVVTEKEKELSNARRRLLELEDRKARLMQDLKGLTVSSASGSLGERVAKLEGWVAIHQKAIERLQTDIKEGLQRLDELKRLAAAKVLERISGSEEKAYHEASRELMRLRKESEALGRELDDWRATIDAARAEAARLETAGKQLRLEVIEDQDRLMALRESGRDEALEREEKRVMDLKNSVDEKIRDYKLAEKEIGKLQKALVEEETANDDLKRRLGMLRAKCEETQQNTENLRSSIRAWEDERVQELASLGVTEADLDKKLGKDKEKSIQAKLEAVEKELAKTPKVNKKALDDLIFFQQEHRRTSTERHELIQSLDKVKQVMAALDRRRSETLRAAFEAVNRNLKEIFSAIVQGGEARLVVKQWSKEKIDEMRRVAQNRSRSSLLSMAAGTEPHSLSSTPAGVNTPSAGPTPIPIHPAQDPAQQRPEGIHTQMGPESESQTSESQRNESQSQTQGSVKPWRLEVADPAAPAAALASAGEELRWDEMARGIELKACFRLTPRRRENDRQRYASLGGTGERGASDGEASDRGGDSDAPVNDALQDSMEDIDETSEGEGGKDGEGEGEGEGGGRGGGLKGKRVFHNVLALSGGQKTVLALSLIFAMQRCQKAPFYILDEVDAALDENYRASVAALIKTLSAESQFLITTFRRELCEASDAHFAVHNENRAATISPCSVDEALDTILQDDQEVADDPLNAQSP